MPTSKLPNFKVKCQKVPISSIFRHNWKVPIFKYYTAQGCLSQGFPVLDASDLRRMDEDIGLYTDYCGLRRTKKGKVI